MLLTIPQSNSYAFKLFSTQTTFGTDRTKLQYTFPEKFNLFKYYKYRHFQGHTANRCSNFPLVKNLILAVVCPQRVLPLVHSPSLKKKFSITWTLDSHRSKYPNTGDVSKLADPKLADFQSSTQVGRLFWAKKIRRSSTQVGRFLRN